MVKAYTGSEILEKVKQVKELIEKDTPVQKIWAKVKINRQTYNRWEKICDDIYTEFESELESQKEQIITLKQQVTQLETKLKTSRSQSRKLKRELKIESEKSQDLSSLQAQLEKANVHIKTAKDKARKLQQQIKEKADCIEQTNLDYTQLQSEYLQAQQQLAKTSEVISENDSLHENNQQIIQENCNLKSELENCKAELSKTKSLLKKIRDSKKQVTHQEQKHPETLASSGYKKEATPTVSETPSNEIQLKSESAPPHEKQDDNKTCLNRESKITILSEKLEKERDRYQDELQSQLQEENTLTEIKQQSSWLNKLYNNAKRFRSEQTCPIGIDIEDECVTLVQLSVNRNGLNLVDAQKLIPPEGMDADSHEWNKWAVHSLKDGFRSGNFRSRSIALALPVRDTFIDHLCMPSEVLHSDYPQEIFGQMQKKLPYKATFENTIVKYIPVEQERVLAIALERQRIDRYLAICEKAKLKPDLFSVWPLAMASCNSHLWIKNNQSFVMLFDVALNYTNIIICQNNTIYLARTIPVGAQDLKTSTMIQLLSEQITATREQFTKLYGNHPIDRNIFLAGQAADRETIKKIVKSTCISAQMGNPFEVINIPPKNTEGVDTKKSCPSWSVAFGLSLQPLTV